MPRPLNWETDSEQDNHGCKDDLLVYGVRGTLRAQINLRGEYMFKPMRLCRLSVKRVVLRTCACLGMRAAMPGCAAAAPARHPRLRQLIEAQCLWYVQHAHALKG